MKLSVYLVASAIIAFAVPGLSNDLQDLIDDAPDGATIRFAGIVTEGIVIDGKSITLDWWGGPIRFDGSGNDITVRNGGDLTIKKLELETSPTAADFTIKIHVEDSSLSLIGCILNNSNHDDTTTILAERSSVLMNGCLVDIGNRGSTLIYARENSSVLVNWSTVNGQISVDESESFEAIGGTFEDDVLIDDTDEVVLSDSKFHHLEVNSNSLFAEKCEFRSNETTFRNSRELSVLDSISENIIIENVGELNLWLLEAGHLSIHNFESAWIDKVTANGVRLRSGSQATIVSSSSIGRPGNPGRCEGNFPFGTAIPGGDGEAALVLNDVDFTMIDRTELVGGDGGSAVACPFNSAPSGDPGKEIAWSDSFWARDDGTLSADFASEEDQWALSAFGGDDYADPTSRLDTEAGTLSIEATELNTLGGLSSAPAPVNTGLTRFRYDLSGSSDNSPQARLRGNSGDFQLGYTAMFSGQEDDLVSIKTAAAPYDLYMRVPVTIDSLMPSLDMIHVDARDGNGAFILNQFRSDWIPVEGEAEIVAAYNLAEGTSGWTFTGHPHYDAAENSVSQAGILLSPPADSSSAIGYWDYQSGVTLEDGYLYEVDFHVSSTASEGERTRVPGFRCRLNESGYRKSSLVHVVSVDDGDLAPTAEDVSVYTTILEPSGAPDQTLLISFDLLHFDDNDSNDIALILEKVVVKRFAVPEM